MLIFTRWHVVPLASTLTRGVQKVLQVDMLN